MIKIEQRVLDFEKLGLGIFVHFGAYSKYKSGEWTLHINKRDKAEYEKAALSQDYSNFDAKNIVNAAKDAGAKYITITTRHHDGFSLFDTKGLSDYGIMHTPHGRDIIAEFCDECRKASIIPFFYHTTLDWHNPDFENDFPAYLEYLRKSIEILCSNYGKIGGFWFDGNWSKPTADWKLDEFYGTIRKLQPDTIIINNTGLEAQGAMGHDELDAVTYEQGVAKSIDFEKIGRRVAGEVCITLNQHWGVANDINYKSMRDLVELACSSRKLSANLLINIGPNADSTIPLMQRAMLHELGKWIDCHKIPFFDGKPCEIEGYNQDFALKTDDGKIYLFVFGITTGGDHNVMRSAFSKNYSIFEGIDKTIKNARWMDSSEVVDFSQDLKSKTLSIKPVKFTYGESWIVRVAEIF